MRIRPNSLGFTLLLGSLATLPPLAIDMGLPALAALGTSLNAPPVATGLTLSLFMALPSRNLSLDHFPIGTDVAQFYWWIVESSHLLA